MKLEPIKHSEVSQKERNKYHVLMCIYGIQKESTDEPIYKEEVETWKQRMDTAGEREGRIIEKGALTYTHYHV